MESVKMNEKSMENILEVTNMLTDNGQQELALDLLVQTLRQCDLETQGLKEPEKEQLNKIRSRLEEKYKDVSKKKTGSSFLRYHASKVAITATGIIIVLLIASIFAGSMISNTVNLIQDKIVGGISKMSETDRLRFLGLLTHNPEVHYQWSLYQERKGKLKKAIQEMELAIGLIDPDKEAYHARLKKLKNKLRK